MKKPTTSAWAVRLLIGWNSYYFGWSKSHPKGFAATLNSTRAGGPLLFATETEAEIAHAAYLSMTPDPFEATVVQVKGSPRHRLTNEGFAPVPLAETFALFAPNPNLL